MSDKEKSIQNYIQKLGISREEAEQLYKDDMEDFIGEEGEALTRQAKQTQHREKASEKDKKKHKPKERKIDADKKHLFEAVLNSLSQQDGVRIESTKTETEITITYNEATYTWKFTKHRPKKNQ